MTDLIQPLLVKLDEYNEVGADPFEWLELASQFRMHRMDSNADYCAKMATVEDLATVRVGDELWDVPREWVE